MFNPRLIYTKSEKKLFGRLDSPAKIQNFLAFEIKNNPAKDGVECRSPREILKFGKAHCMEGALLAAAILEFHGHKPLLMDLRSTSEDLDHVVALFRPNGYWGAISKTNHVVLRYREPIYKSPRELAVTYFHEYFLDNGKKTLREYSEPINLRGYKKLNWRITDEDLVDMPKWIDKQKHFKILSSAQIKNLRLADRIEIEAGKLTEWRS